MNNNLSRELLVYDMLHRSAKRFPNKEIIVFEDKRVTYKEMVSNVNKLAHWLQQQGIKKGDKVAGLLFNGVEFIESLFATVKIGAVFVPINYRLTEPEIEYILSHSDSKLVIFDKKFSEEINNIKERIPGLEILVQLGQNEFNDDDIFKYTQIMTQPEVEAKSPRLTDNDECLILYTSGTTGRPKGVVLTHKNVFINAMNMCIEFNLTRNDTQLVTTPLFHIAGISASTMFIFISGTSVIHQRFDPLTFIQTIEKEKVNYAFMVPSMWDMVISHPDFHKYNVDSLRIINTAATTTPLELKKRLMKSFPNGSVFDTFGMTETAASTATLKGYDPLDKTGTVGMPYTNVEIKVVDDFMNEVKPGEVGEILYRGPTMMKEYYKNPIETEKAFKGGWFHSGDLVTLDEDGYISIVGRKKDMIISGGENIYPKEIEEVLYTHPDIVDAAVVGIPDPKWGETPKAFIVKAPNSMLTADQVIEYLDNKIANYKKPRHVEFINEMPRNASGKILKHVLKSTEIKDGKLV